ncbi:hypothetical protein ACIGBH_27430 [Streptomyces sp. NPDC085929]|uniref:hypothetical protein n=1 Tax=Streptomyces sp. NPDC085929 TaxID=3365739 RepID=UPI0037D2824E
MTEPPKQTYPCCAIPLFIVLILTIIGSCSGNSAETDTPRQQQPASRYGDSLCEGSDYAKYDDCRNP